MRRALLPSPPTSLRDSSITRYRVGFSIQRQTQSLGQRVRVAGRYQLGGRTQDLSCHGQVSRYDGDAAGKRLDRWQTEALIHRRKGETSRSGNDGS